MRKLPSVFLPYQKQLMQSVYANPVTVVEKSRRTGYSWAMGGIAALIASAQSSAGGQDVLYLGYNLEMAREFIDYVAEFSKQILTVTADVQDTVFEDDTRPEKSIKAFRIEFASGFKVLALPSVPRSLRGMQGLVVIDEAAFHDDLPEVMKAAFALLIWGGKVVIISTHDGADSDYVAWAKEVPGVTRAWCYPNAMGLGTVTVRFVMDNKTDTILPDENEINAVRNYIMSKVPATVEEVYVMAPTAKVIDFVINDLNPNDDDTKASIRSNLEDLFLSAEPGKVLKLNAIRNAVITVTEDHVLAAPTADIHTQAHELAILGTISYGTSEGA